MGCYVLFEFYKKDKMKNNRLLYDNSYIVLENIKNLEDKVLNCIKRAGKKGNKIIYVNNYQLKDQKEYKGIEVFQVVADSNETKENNKEFFKFKVRQINISNKNLILKKLNETYKEKIPKAFKLNDEYIVDECIDELDEYIDILIDLLKHFKQIILQGPPGTGKTRLAKIIALNLIGEKIDNKIANAELKNKIKEKSEQIQIVQFHPNYSYEDFVRGIKVEIDNSSKLPVYKIENKILGEIAENALKNLEKNYVLIIDEINRANLSSVLGELIYALEYRGDEVESMYTLDENNSRKLILPENLYIIGTMNTADRSIGHMDYAIRRRFAFEFIGVDDKIIENKMIFNKVKKLFYNENNNRSEYLSKEFEPQDVIPGHYYFMGEDLEYKLKYKLIPLLEEYIKDGILKESAKEKIEKIKNVLC